MQRSLIDFLNHGTTPFVGREQEVERILSFLGHEEGERNGLESLLLLGEAGVGKSRLIESCIGRGETSLQAILHIRLRPEGSLHFARMITEGIERSRTARELFRRPTESLDDLAEGVGMIRRLAALRRTGLIIEDVHLLDGERLNEFLYILDILRDEPISLLAAARPVDFPARGILEPYIRDEISVVGLTPDDLRDLWRTFFDSPIDHHVAAVLIEVTGGNPLALRSALRSGIRNGLFNERGRNEGEILNLKTFREIGLRTAHSLAEGMTADLESGLREALERLALLGEVFSPEGAGVLLGDTAELIRTLIFRGILVRSLTPVIPVNNRWSFDRNDLMRQLHISPSVTPIAFTHTLLHFDLLQRAERPVRDLIRLLASGAPLLTYYPYTLLIECLESLPNDSEVARSFNREEVLLAVDRTCQAARSINAGAEWERAPVLLRAASLLFERVRDSLDQGRRDEFDALILLTELEAGFRPNGLAERGPMSERLYRLTLKREEMSMVQIHLKSISFLFRVAIDGDGVGEEGIWLTRGLELVDRYPEVRSSREYISFIHMVANHGLNRGDHSTLRILRTRVERDVADESIPDWVRRYLRRRLVPHFFELYTDQDELEETVRTIAALDREYPPIESLYEIGDLPFYSMKLSFWFMSCMPHDVLRLGPAVLAHARRFSLDGTDASTMRQMMTARGLISGDREEMRREFDAYIEYCRSARPNRAGIQRMDLVRVVRTLSFIGVLLDDMEIIRWGLQRVELPAEVLNLGELMSLLLHEQKFDELRDLVARFPEGLRPMAMICFEPPEDRESVLQQYVAQFDHHEFSSLALIRYHNAFDLIERGIACGNINWTTELERSMQGAMRHALEFLAERQLPRVIEPLLRRHGNLLPEKDRSEWQIRVEEMNSRSRGDADRIEVTMLESITITSRAGEAIRVRGGRSRQLLGLLTAMKMVGRPLNRQEFFRIASGVEDDLEKGRTSTNVALLRLRELIGQDSIRTGSELPELDPERVRVDLLDLWDLLRRAEEEVASGRLVKGRENLEKVIRGGAGRVAFPGLYDRVFEGLRDEFEGRLRGLLVTVSDRLLSSDDPVGAEELLRVWVERIPEDEEALGLLSRALRLQGREGEAALTTPG